eukprot:scaffold1982_cov115-Isochrysis_galbana.AAC.3
MVAWAGGAPGCCHLMELLEKVAVRTHAVDRDGAAEPCGAAQLQAEGVQLCRIRWRGRRRPRPVESDLAHERGRVGTQSGLELVGPVGRSRIHKPGMKAEAERGRALAAQPGLLKEGPVGRVRAHQAEVFQTASIVTAAAHVAVGVDEPQPGPRRRGRSTRAAKLDAEEDRAGTCCS